MLEILVIVGTILLLYYLTVKPYDYWSKRNVKTGPFLPFFGHSLYFLLGKENFAQFSGRIYRKLKDVRYVGIYNLMTPALIIKSPELIKQICVKDFDHFMDHNSIVPDGVDELWSKNLLALRGHTWKNMRPKLSPSFTSKKIKSMFTLICQNADSFREYFMKKNGHIIEVDFKDTFTRYTNDAIASTAFGIEIDSLKDRNNEFYLMGREVVDLGSLKMKIIMSAYHFFPTICKFFRLPLLGDKPKNFFINIVKDTIKLREKTNFKRNDMLGLLIEARKGQQNEDNTDEVKDNSFAATEEHFAGNQGAGDLSDMDIAAQVFIFFLAGFDTVSSAMCFMAYELAANPEVQKKLIDEIDRNKPDTWPPSYDTIANMPYIDMVVTETLRKWPISGTLDRVVTKPYVIEPKLPGEKPVHLEKDTMIVIPSFAIQRDPENYKDPERFDPERFSPENRKNVDPYIFLPFGIGPRNCIGSRFALLEIKSVFFYLLSHFEIVPVEKTHIPLKINKNSMTLNSEHGFVMGLKRRK
ncbi:hypothetical protein WA026_005476 [Henosepilachna vigintioctopunctata]|uniref:Cytochrome P450 n=1 Tax=Henosepilachna vigintioctopunctata TaxID=420089 RepID=A0AAW1U1T4_9CUCU